MNCKWLSLTSSLSVIPKEGKLAEEKKESEFTPRGDYKGDNKKDKRNFSNPEKCFCISEHQKSSRDR